MKIIEKLRDLYKNLNLFNKFQLALFIVSSLSLPIMGLTGFYEGRKALSERSFELLQNLSKNRKNAIEEYFDLVGKQITTSAQSPNNVKIFREFQQAFAQDRQNPLDNTQKNAIKEYYDKEFIPKLNYNSLENNNEIEFVPADPAAQKIQYHYITENANPDNFKYILNTSKAGNLNYDKVHAKYHPIFLRYQQTFDYEDIMMIDKEGNVLYSVNKDVDFMSNLSRGAFRNSNAAKLFRKVLQSKEERKVFFEDYAHYMPNYYQPTCFVATAIESQEANQNKRKIGVLMFRISNRKLTDIMTNEQGWVEDGLSTSGEINLFGSDFKVRTNTRSILQDPLAYQENLLNGGVDANLVEKIKRLNTTILLRERQAPAVVAALKGQGGSETNIDFLGNEVLMVYLPVNILGVNWAMITEINGEEIYAPIERFRQQLLIIGGIIFVLITLVGVVLARSLSRPMLKIQREISLLASGVFPKRSIKIYKDELGKIDAALNALIDNMQKVAEFAKNIGNGNFDQQLEVKNDNDILAKSLVSMRDNLKRVSAEEQERSWISTGTAKFNELMRDNNQSIEQLSKATLPELVRYLEASLGAIFIYNAESKHLEVSSAYAYDKSKKLDLQVIPGEGLVGQCFLEGRYNYLTQLPTDYSTIISGLGQIPPKSAVFVPLKANDGQIHGVLELASIRELETYEIHFLEAFAEDIATTINQIKVNEETRRLLQESQYVTEQLRQQEEEMRQNFEELMSSQEDMRRQQQRIDLMLSGEFTKEDLQELNIDTDDLQNINLALDKEHLEGKVRKAIMRQKDILDKAVAENKKRERNIKRKIAHLDKLREDEKSNKA